MSLAKLPTELDKFIISYLGQDQKGDLYAMSRVSKYWHSLVEPVLYNDVTFHTDCHRRISRLCLSLIKRLDLATLIQSFTLTPTPSSPSPAAAATATATGNLEGRNLVFLNKTAIVESTINDIGKTLDRVLLIDWSGYIIVDQELIDRVVAAILCLATNLEHLHLDTDKDELYITHSLLAYNWLSADTNVETFPFCKLKSICMKQIGRKIAIVLPWLDTLWAIGTIPCYPWPDCHPLRFPYPSPIAGTALRVLEINNFRPDATILRKLLVTPGLRNIKELRVIKKRTGIGFWLRGNNLQIMSQVIEANMTDLETLEWSGLYMSFRSLSSFGSFKGLSKLWELKVDVQLLTPVHEEVLPHFAHPGEYLPDSLKILHISNLPEHDQRIDQIMNAARAMCGLQAVELSLDLDIRDRRGVDPSKWGLSELSASRRGLFCGRVVDMAESGVTMRVWRQESVYSKQLLFALGYQRPWPIWADVD